MSCPPAITGVYLGACVYSNVLNTNDALHSAINDCCSSVNGNFAGDTQDGCATICQNTSYNSQLAFLQCISDKNVDGTADNKPACDKTNLATTPIFDGRQAASTVASAASSSTNAATTGSSQKTLPLTILSKTSSPSSTGSPSSKPTTASTTLKSSSAPASSTAASPSPSKAGASSVVISKKGLGVMGLLLMGLFAA